VSVYGHFHSHARASARRLLSFKLNFCFTLLNI